jgi:N-acetylated-alpha-linked acidic dipeptidase
LTTSLVKKFGDPDFTYEQQMARVFGIQTIRMADADVLPYDYETYGREISNYIEAGEKKATTNLVPTPCALTPPPKPPAVRARRRENFCTSEESIWRCRTPQPNSAPSRGCAADSRRVAQPSLVSSRHLRTRPIHGLRAVVIPGVNEAIDNTI